MPIKISNRIINNDKPALIIAELSANHNKKKELAIESIRAMKQAGADAVKIQTYTPDTITINSKNDYFKLQQGTLWDGQTLYGLYEKAYTPWDWQPELKKIAEDLGLIFFSSPFDKSAVDFLEEMDVPTYKVASFEITDIPLIKYIALKGKPIIISTGIASISDIEEAITVCKKMGNEQIILLKCTSAYPAPIDEMNLLTIPDMAKRFKKIIGLSDHTLGPNISVAAVALGAKVIEKHFIIDRKLGGPDAEFSTEPDEFKLMVNGIREVEKALGKINYELSDKIKKNKIFSRSLFVVKDIKKGEIFTEENIRSIRPGHGLHPRHLEEIIGKKSMGDLKRGEPLKWEMVE